MFKIPIAEIKEKIVASGKISAEDLENKIKFKINELSGLISEEGAAHILANELGVEIISKEQGKLKIKEIYSGMKSVNTVGKVVTKYDVREFSKGDKQGKVCSLVLGDETGVVRVVFWNEQVDLLKDVNEGDIILVNDAYARENNNNREVHLGQRGSIEINPEGEIVGNVRQSTEFERKNIGELKGGESAVEVLGTVVQVFDPRFFYLCPQCNKRANEAEGGFKCDTHGVVEPALSYVLNLIMDDGSANIRTVFWKKQTNHLLDTNEEKMAKYKEDLGGFDNLKNDLLGEQFKLLGKVVQNQMFERLEFSVQMVEKAKAEDEIAKLEKTE